MQFDRLHRKDFATLGCAVFGFLALVFAASHWIASLFVAVAAVLDALDGHLARGRGKANDFGRELDSLADAVAFGAAPAFILFWPFRDSAIAWFYAASAVVFLSACLIRLARFNLYAAEHHKTRPGEKSVYYGLPAPAAALLLVFLAPAFGIFVPALALVLGGLMLAGFEIQKPF
ncbi:CDP-alcohol phosphatidyltransferase family protein [Candidatus Micrarchaeota archaeon]|nr:CDP-alcohol phosphatidyltransferase family protein [Candidatus Micrarchaeota archaeon]